MVALSPITERDNNTTGRSRFLDDDDLGCSSIEYSSHLNTDCHYRNGDDNNKRQSNSNSSCNNSVKDAAVVEEQRQQQQQYVREILDDVEQRHHVEGQQQQQQVSRDDTDTDTDTANDGSTQTGSTNCSISIRTDIAKLWIDKHDHAKKDDAETREQQQQQVSPAENRMLTNGLSESTTTDIDELWNDDDTEKKKKKADDNDNKYTEASTRSASIRTASTRSASVTKRTTNTTQQHALHNSVRTMARTEYVTMTPSINEHKESLFLSEQLEETQISSNHKTDPLLADEKQQQQQCRPQNDDDGDTDDIQQQPSQYEEDLLDVFFESVHDRICHERSTRSEQRSHLSCLSQEEEEQNDAMIVCQLLLDPLLNHLETYDPLFEKLEHLVCPEENDHESIIMKTQAACKTTTSDAVPVCIGDNDACFSTMVVCGKGTTPTHASLITNMSSLTDNPPPPPPGPPPPPPPPSPRATLTQLLDRVEKFDPYFEQCTEKMEQLFAKKKENGENNDDNTQLKK